MPGGRGKKIEKSGNRCRELTRSIREDEERGECNDRYEKIGTRRCFRRIQSLLNADRGWPWKEEKRKGRGDNMVRIQNRGARLLHAIEDTRPRERTPGSES